MEKSNANGFTLLEIMIALAIIGGLLVTLIYSLNYHLSLAEKHEFVTEATLLAKNKITETGKKPVQAKGEFPEPYIGYHYSVELKQSQFPGISEIHVSVSKGTETVRLMKLIETPQ